MNPEVKTKWVAALRSGEYKQGKDYLRREDNTFCCLGVLCDIAAREGVGTWQDDGFVASDDEFAADASLTPYAVQRWAGLEGANPEMATDSDYPEALSALNDNGVPFADIADLIEAQL